MLYSTPSRCPVCGGTLTVTRLSCPKCASEISGSFTPCRYCSLSGKDRLFLETFLKCRGNIREVERSLSLSYPTVKGMLESLLATLFPSDFASGGKTGAEAAADTGDVLDRLERGEITAQQAAEMLSGKKERRDSDE